MLYESFRRTRGKLSNFFYHDQHPIGSCYVCSVPIHSKQTSGAGKLGHKPWANQSMTAVFSWCPRHTMKLFLDSRPMRESFQPFVEQKPFPEPKITKSLLSREVKLMRGIRFRLQI